MKHNFKKLVAQLSKSPHSAINEGNIDEEIRLAVYADLTASSSHVGLNPHMWKQQMETANKAEADDAHYFRWARGVPWDAALRHYLAAAS